MLVRLSEGLWGVCKILVGVQEYLRILLLVFHAYKLLQPRQTVIIRFHAALDRHRLVRQICMDTLSGILFNRLFSISSFTTVSRSPLQYLNHILFQEFVQKYDHPDVCV